MAAPADPGDSAELARILASLDAAYGRGKWCKDATRPGSCLDVNQITNVMAASRNPAELREVWEGWHAIAPPMRSDYVRFVDLANKGARELGFADTGALWRSKYDMPPDAFAKELDRLWDQVRPLYLSLHAYVRMRLHQKYGDAVPASGPIPAHMLGNIWAQDWSNVYPLVAPANADPGYSLDRILASAEDRRRWTWRRRPSASSRRSASRRCRRRSGSDRCSSSRATATSCATPARGTSTR